MLNQDTKTHAHCIYSMHYHIVFVTKYRHKALSPIMLGRLKDHFSRICSNAGCELKEMNGVADHVHLLVETNPNILPSRLVNTLKTISSREIRKEFAHDLSQFYWKPYLWTRAYCIVSAGGAPLDIIKQYIQNQPG